MTKPGILLISLTLCLCATTSQADSDNRSGFGFGMGSSTPERSGNNYGWGFGPADDYQDQRSRREGGIEQSTTRGGMSWGSGRSRYGNNRPFFSYGSRRNYYAPPPHWGSPYGQRPYPPAAYPYRPTHQPPPANNTAD